MDLGAVTRTVGARLLDEEAWGEMWKEAEREKRRWREKEPGGEERKKREVEEEREKRGVEEEKRVKAEGTGPGAEGVPEKKKKK